MAKKNNLFKETKKELVGKSKLKRLKKKSTNFIAYKLPASKLQELLDENLRSPQEWTDWYNALNTADRSELGLNHPPELSLLGLRFDFKEDNKPIDYIKIYQVYFDAKNLLFLKFHPSNDDYLTVLEEELIFPIEEYKNSDVSASLSHHELASTCITLPSNYTKLDFYKVGMDFVYFSIDQIEFIIDNYAQIGGDIILSGSLLNLGKKLAHPSQKPKGKYEESFFTLKMEGVRNTLTSKVAVSVTEDIDRSASPDIAVGQPCPPEWASIAGVYAAAKRINPTVNYKMILNGWTKNVVAVLHTSGGIAAK